MPQLAVFDAELELRVGETRLVLIHPKWAHTGGDTMVYLPENKVLYSGDIVWNEYHPNLEVGDIPEWISALKGYFKVETCRYRPRSWTNNQYSRRRLSGPLPKWFDTRTLAPGQEPGGNRSHNRRNETSPQRAMEARNDRQAQRRDSLS